ncbi:CRISPR-associated endonuclease Cas6 [Algoriphagus formosus]|uniref:CRISPR-associated endonuclease Cas6 n=1 Tax=Algoriphagus formosus TaxID=2007308 RepID=UPI000C294D43|nr:CRISPR-associated endonuclease Cas6 [Algoriphagus formosus]
MKTIRVIKISFNTPLKNSEILAFRGAIVDLVGRDHIIFHNHIEGNKFDYTYPLIQYQSKKNKAEIISIHHGTEEIHHLFLKNLGEIKIGKNPRPLFVENIKINQFNLGVNGTYHRYRLQNWLPLNESNYRRYQDLSDLSEKVEFLEKILIGNILSFAKGVSWKIQEKIEVKISDIPKVNKVRRKQQDLMAFTIEFKSNVLLPPDIGLGKSVSVGYGKIIKHSTL